MNGYTTLVRSSILSLAGLAAFFGAANTFAQAGKKVIFERVSQYHHIQVYDEDGIRTLSFNGSWETKMSLEDPQTGHFEYTEYFQMPFIWNRDIKRVLMAGLGGGSTQRAYGHYYTNVFVDTVEIDPAVVEVAEKYFHVTESSHLQIHTNDARQYLRRSTNKFDVILMDAYSTTRYGSSLPVELTTKEFFTNACDHLTTNGVLCYNVIGQIKGSREKLIGALYRTMAEVFPQVYLFPADESQNVVFLATRNPEHVTWAEVQGEAGALVRDGIVTLPTFANRARNFNNTPPATAADAIILTDDHAPIESLMEESK